MADYTSEAEDQPRMVQNLDQDYKILFTEPPVTIKLGELPEASRRCRRGEVLPIRPIPDPQVVARAVNAMGNKRDGVWTGTVFNPPNHEDPAFVFPSRQVNTADGRVLKRFCIRRRFVPWITDLKTMAVFTGGERSHERQGCPHGGFSFVFNDTPGGVISRALKKKGPTGEQMAHTMERAQLRAVIAFLNYRTWWGEGWNHIIIITNCQYVRNGATDLMRKWSAQGWKTCRRIPVANHDLWKALSDAMGHYAAGGCEISFWVVPPQFNRAADDAAKTAALLQSDELYHDEQSIGV